MQSTTVQSDREFSDELRRRQLVKILLQSIPTYTVHNGDKLADRMPGDRIGECVVVRFKTKAKKKTKFPYLQNSGGSLRAEITQLLNRLQA